jgi:serine protease AprX
MRKLLFLFFLVTAMQAAAQAPSKYIVRFTDRNGSPYSTSNPSAYLSQRAVTRRAVQNIPIAQNDLPVNPSYIASVLNTGSVQLLNRSKWFNAISIYTTDANALNSIQNLPFVVSVDPVQRHASPLMNESETAPSAQKVEPQADISQQFSFNYGPSYNQIAMLGGDCLHNMGFQGQGKLIAVLDAGFYSVDTLPAFDSLWINNQVLATWDFVQGNSSVFEDNMHGEMTLSCMAGNLPGQLVGTAPKAQYLLLRSEEAATEYVIEEFNWVAAAEYADSAGADVINSSLGYTTFDDPSQNHTYSDMDGNTAIISIGADIAVSKGVFVVNSAGNEGGSSWMYIGAPADGDSVLAVGAVDAGGNYANFSSRGPSADGQVKPDISAQGQGTIVAAPGGGIQPANGTSFSSPVTAGLVACLWQAHPGLTARQLYYAIIESGSQYGSPDTYLGYGIPDFCAANLILGGADPAQFESDNLMTVYPNPFGDSFEFSFYSDSKQPVIIELFDVTGRKVASGSYDVAMRSHNNYMVTAPGLRQGIYLLVLRTEDSKFVRKISKF